jgi:hypothetical protein
MDPHASFRNTIGHDGEPAAICPLPGRASDVLTPSSKVDAPRPPIVEMNDDVGDDSPSAKLKSGSSWRKPESMACIGNANSGKLVVIMVMFSNP